MKYSQRHKETYGLNELPDDKYQQRNGTYKRMQREIFKTEKYNNWNKNFTGWVLADSRIKNQWYWRLSIKFFQSEQHRKNNLNNMNRISEPEE